MRLRTWRAWHAGIPTERDGAVTGGRGREPGVSRKTVRLTGRGEPGEGEEDAYRGGYGSNPLALLRCSGTRPESSSPDVINYSEAESLCGILIALNAPVLMIYSVMLILIKPNQP